MLDVLGVSPSHELPTSETEKAFTLINTVKKIDGYKKELYSSIFHSEKSHFVETTEHGLGDLKAVIQKHIFVGLFIDALILSLIAYLVYHQRVKEFAENESINQAALEKLEQANEAKSTFLATMSHELRTPMNGVLGLAEIIREDTKEADTKEHVQVILDSGRHLVTLLNDILDISKVEGGELKLEKCPFRLSELIDLVSNSLGSISETKGVALKITSDVPEHLSLVGDPSRVRQIVFNLVGNALKFTEQGSVDLHFELDDGEQQGLLIRVKDTGVGIERDKLDTIFAPFQQADLSTTRKFGGTGLGLTIVKQLTHLMGGDIQVFSQFGVGSKFTVILPIECVAAAAEGVASSPSRSQSENNQTGKRALSILLVEDNQVNAVVANRFLKNFGCEVTIVNDGLEALTILAEQGFDLIIMDNHMPRLSGVDTIKQIREELKLDTVIFGYTADVFQHAHDEFISAGANYVLTKPLQQSTLHSALEQFSEHFSDNLKLSPFEDTPSNVIPLKRVQIENLPITEEEISQSPLLNSEGLEEQDRVELLDALKCELEIAYEGVINAYAESDLEELNEKLHSLKGIAYEFGLETFGALAVENESQVRNKKLPEAGQLQKMVNLILVNNHQVSRMLGSTTKNKDVG
ncbi:sensor histidine kinase [Vibrio ishigakensis]|uniref:histidine kinase n=1 Tax=Vibrio ishigakensis TaxID=1481914 RepID=A0A0B8PRN0_9VIBR|nr:sensor histidine kinase [Vibrio ishigakensis]